MTKRNLITVAMWMGYGLSIFLGAETHSIAFAIPVLVLGFWATLRTLGEA